MTLRWLHLFLVALVLPASGCDDGDARETRRRMAIECYNSFADNRRAAEIFQRKSQEAAALDEVRLYVRRWQSAVERIAPFEPLGVDTELGRAISEFRSAALARVAMSDRILDGRSPGKDEIEAITSREEEAARKVEAEINRLAGELGGIVRERE